MRLEQILCGKSVMQFICTIVIAVTTVFHVDASLASTPLGADAFVADSQDDETGKAGKIVVDQCHFCSHAAACADLLTPSSVGPRRQLVPPGKTRNLIAYQLPAIAPPPRS